MCFIQERVEAAAAEIKLSVDLTRGDLKKGTLVKQSRKFCRAEGTGGRVTHVYDNLPVG
jgi:hypothetical protein